MAKAKLSSLVHELRERIAASSSTPTSNPLGVGSAPTSEDDVLEVRFRSVLPNLLNAYLGPPCSSSANEREVIAVVKLISHTAKYFPGVFYHGSASSILPILARILPFFADPLFRSRHGVFFESLGSLLSLLRTGARDAYRLFFLDAMSLIQDILHVASLCLRHATVDGSCRLALKCFCDSFSGIEDLPATHKPVDGCGLLVDLSGQARWQPFVTWILKLLSKCLTEGTLYVEGLISASFVSAACSLLCYGDAADLHMASLCGAYARIARVCPPHIWQPESLISALYHPEPFLPLVECLQVALSALGPHLVGGIQGNDNTSTMLASKDQSAESTRLGQKRLIQDIDNLKIKRQKLNEETAVSDASVEVECKYSFIVTCQRVEDYANHMNLSLLSFVQSLTAPAVRPGSLRPNTALSALSMLCIAISVYPETNLYLIIVQQMLAWLPWIAEQAKQGNLITVDISTYLEGIHSILLSQSASFKEINPLQVEHYRADLIFAVLKLPWTHTLIAVDNHCPWKTKCLALQVLSKLGPNLSSKIVLEVLDLGLRDEAKEVRTEAAISMPVMVLWSSIDISSPIIKMME